MNAPKILSITVMIALFAAGSVFAQVQQQPQQQDLPTSDDVSDEEIVQLANAIDDLEPIQIEAQEKIKTAVEEEEISYERFEQMMMAMQNPQMADQMDITEEEEQKIQTLQPTLMQIQGDAQQKMTEKIEEHGLTPQRYSEIIMGAQQDPELMARVEKELGVSDEDSEG